MFIGEGALNKSMDACKSSGSKLLSLIKTCGEKQRKCNNSWICPMVAGKVLAILAVHVYDRLDNET